MAKNLTINTTLLANLLNIDEGKLVYALKTEGKLHGVEFPPQIHNSLHPSRKFNYEAALAFVEQVKKAR